MLCVDTKESDKIVRIVRFCVEVVNNNGMEILSIYDQKIIKKFIKT